MSDARDFTVLDIDHTTGITVIGHVDDIARRIFLNLDEEALGFTRVYWQNPEDGDDEWEYDERPVYIRPSTVRFACGLPGPQVHSLERARIEA